MTSPSTTVRSVSPESHELMMVNFPEPFTAPSTTLRSTVHSPLALAIVPEMTVASYSSST